MLGLLAAVAAAAVPTHQFQIRYAPPATMPSVRMSPMGSPLAIYFFTTIKRTKAPAR